MAPLVLSRCAACCFAVLATACLVPAVAAPFLIVGNDEKPGTDAQGKPIINPTGNDTVQILDLAQAGGAEDRRHPEAGELHRRPAGQPGHFARTAASRWWPTR